MAFTKLFRYASQRKVKKKMNNFYQAKIMSKTFNKLRNIARGQRNRKSLILNQQKEKSIIKYKENVMFGLKNYANIKLLRKKLYEKADIFHAQILFKTAFNALHQSSIIEKNNEKADILYQNNLLKNSLFLFKSSCQAYHELLEAKFEAIKKASQKRKLKLVFTILENMHNKILKRKSKLQSLFLIYQRFLIKRNLREFRIQIRKISRSFLYKKEILAILKQHTFTQFNKIHKHNYQKIITKVFKGFQFFNCSQKLKKVQNLSAKTHFVQYCQKRILQKLHENSVIKKTAILVSENHIFAEMKKILLKWKQEMLKIRYIKGALFEYTKLRNAKIKQNIFYYFKRVYEKSVKMNTSQFIIDKLQNKGKIEKNEKLIKSINLRKNEISETDKKQYNGAYALWKVKLLEKIFKNWQNYFIVFFSKLKKK